MPVRVSDLGPRRQVMRRLFVTQECARWVLELKELPDSGGGLLSPYAEFFSVAADFIAGSKVGSIIKAVSPPRGEHIFRFQTASLRICGWCPEPQVLILTHGALADKTHGAARIISITELGKKTVEQRREFGVTSWEVGGWHELFRAES